MQEIGLKLLQSVGCPEGAATDEMIAKAVELNDQFVAEAARQSCSLNFSAAQTRRHLIHLGVSHHAALEVLRERRAGNGDGDCYN